MNDFPSTPDEFTPRWVEAALGAGPGSITACGVEPIGTGQIADSYRLGLRWADRGSEADGSEADRSEADGSEGPDRPKSVVAKCPSNDETSLATARNLGLYAKEVAWYGGLAGHTSIRVPACHHAHVNTEGDRFALVLEDCAPGRQGDQLAGVDLARIRAALDEAARLHAAFIDPVRHEELEWLAPTAEARTLRRDLIARFWPPFRERYHGRLDDDLLELGDHMIQAVTSRTDDPTPQPVTIVHGDFRVDNMLFDHPDGRVVVVDWQTFTLGHPLSDVAYLVGTSIADPDLRQAGERGLVDHYCERMAEHGAPLDRDDAWTAYQTWAVSGFVMAVTASMLAGRTGRGDEMFAVMAERPARQMADLDTLSLW